MSRELQPCGTHAAYQRHLRNGEVTCQPCRDAHAAQNRVPAEQRGTPRPDAPCPSKAAKARHRRRGEHCDTCAATSRWALMKPCGTEAAAQRHRKAHEPLCEPCREVDRARASARHKAHYVPSSRQLAPCGTRAARGRHRYRGEDCATCDGVRDRAREARLKPCGTTAAYSRHMRAGERPCRPCRDAENARVRAYKNPTGNPIGPPRFRGCGSEAGYRYHLRHKTEPCQPCREAHRIGQGRAPSTKREAA